MGVIFGVDQVTPDVRLCTSAPPNSSAVTTSPVAAFTRGGPARKIVPWFRDVDRLVRRRLRRRRPMQGHHNGDLGDALRRHLGLVVEDATEMISTREHFVLIGANWRRRYPQDGPDSQFCSAISWARRCFCTMRKIGARL